MRTKRQWKMREVGRLMANNHYDLARISGGHYIYTKEGVNHISIPLDPNAMIMARLIKENALISDTDF